MSLASPQPDSLLARASRDSATIDSSGTRIETAIDGVIAHRPPLHIDHRGALTEMFTDPSFWAEPFAYAYQTSVRPGMLKGWFAHQEKADRYHLATGELLVFLYDDRPESKTRGRSQRIVLSERGVRQVYIPRQVWHLSLNIGVDEAIIVNLPTTLYDPANPDRFHIPYDSPDIPVDVRSYFPVTNIGAESPQSHSC